MSDVEGKRICLGSNYDRKVGYIEDIMVKILFKLPVKHLLKCKTVSKMWKDLIGEHHFSKLHFSNSRKNPKLVVYIDSDVRDSDSYLYLIEESGRDMQFPGFAHGLSLELISFNGLICFTDMAGKDLLIQICNPFTQEFHVLPKGTPSVEHPRVGVVFDPKNHKYKVLRFFRHNLKPEDEYYKCETYTPDTKAWTMIGEVPCPDVFPGKPTQVNVGGRVYWLMWSRCLNWVPTYILSVDMEDHFTRVELPENAIDEFGFDDLTYLVEFENQLLLIGVDDSEDYLLIWSLQDHNQSSWSYLGPVKHTMPDMGLDAIGSIAAVKNELLFTLMPSGAERYRYRMLNMETKTWRVLPVSSKFTKDFPVVLPFTESLFKCDATY